MNHHPTPALPRPRLEPRPLADLLPTEHRVGFPAATLPDGTPVVILRRSAPEHIEVFHHGQIHDVTDTTPAAAITDTGRTTWLVQQALQAVTRHYHSSEAQTARLRAEADRLRAEAHSVDALHATRLADIRDYVIERHEAGEIDRERLDAFLERCGMTEHRRRIRVQFRITGCYEVDGRDGDDARAAATERLYVDLRDVDGLVPDSDEYTVTVTTGEDVAR